MHLRLLAFVRNNFKPGALEVVAFSTGFCLMAYELVASRILAPTIGSSTYVWTSVIGVIIAALSVGYTIGGIIADKRVKHTDIALLLLGTTLAMLTTVLFSDDLLLSIRNLVSDARWRGLIASLLLFMPASFLLGVISPYLVRLHTSSVSKAGRSVAALSTMNAIGGIVGTFTAGFLFFGYIGSVQTIALLCVLLVATSWLIAPKQDTQIRLMATIAIAALAVIAYLPQITRSAEAQGIRNIDTAFSHYRIIDYTNTTGQNIRVLSNGPQGGQSAIDTKNPKELVFEYTQALAKGVDQAPHKKRIAILGGGTYTLPHYLATKYPNSQIDVIEIDPELLGIAKTYFQYQPTTNTRHIAADARTFLNSTHQPYDIIIADVYNDTSVPFSLSTVEYTARLHHNLAQQGTVLVNAIMSPSKACRPLLGSINATYLQNFTYSRAFALENWSVSGRQNIIMGYSNASLNWLRLGHSDITAKLSQARLLTDNFAPVEKLTFACAS